MTSRNESTRAWASCFSATGFLSWASDAVTNANVASATKPGAIRKKRMEVSLVALPELLCQVRQSSWTRQLIQRDDRSPARPRKVAFPDLAAIAQLRIQPQLPFQV